MNLVLKQKLEINDALIIASYPGEKLAFCKPPLIKLFGEYIENLNNDEDWKGEFAKIRTWNVVDNGVERHLIVIGMGDKYSDEKTKQAFSVAYRYLDKFKFKEVSVCVDTFLQTGKPTDVMYNLAESAILSAYKFDKYHTDKPRKPNLDLHLACEAWDDGFEASAEKAKVIAAATNFARDLVNEPANVVTPVTLAKLTEEAGKKFGFETEIKDEKAIAELKMEAFIQVAKGSIIPPRLIIMRYMNNPKSNEILGLVGKGLTYDSGGYSIKPTNSMMNMKCDMGGSASVIGAMAAIAGVKEKVNVVAVVAACENMLSGSAYRPGDVIGSMGGKYIEVVNTDAEGRLTLIDAVTYAQRNEKVTKLVDIATLTGGAVTALGTIRNAVISNNDEFYQQLEQASEQSGEKIWRMPTDAEYLELIKSKIGDLKNSAGAGASMVTAGMFIGEFIGDIPWMHIDIAGKALASKEKYYTPAGGTGVGVRLLHNLAKL